MNAHVRPRAGASSCGGRQHQKQQQRVWPEARRHGPAAVTAAAARGAVAPPAAPSAQAPQQLHCEPAAIPPPRQQQQGPPPRGRRLRQQQQQQQPPLPQHPGAAVRAPPAPVLTSLLTSAAGQHDLEGLVGAYGRHFGPIHVSAALCRLAKLAVAPQERRQQQQGQQPWPPQQDGRQQPRASPAQLAAAQRFARRSLLPLVERHAPAMSPRSLANTTWALAKLGVPPGGSAWAARALLGGVAAAARDLGPQELGAVLYALAQWSQQQQQQRGQLEQVPAPAVAADGAIAPAAAALAALGAPPELPRALLEAAAGSLPQFNPQSLSNTLYALALLELVPDAGWQARFWDASRPKLRQAEPQHLSNTLWAAARLRLSPPPAWRGAWLAASARSLQEATPQGLSNSLWAVAKLGWGADALRPLGSGGGSTEGGAGLGEAAAGPAAATAPPLAAGGGCWLAAFARASAGRLGQFSGQALTNSFWAVGSVARQLLEAELQGEPGAPLLPACRRLRWLMSAGGWHLRAAAALEPLLPELTTQQLSNALWGFASAGLAPPAPWLCAYIRASGPRLLAFRDQELSSALVAFAKLGHSPGPSWLRLCEAALGQRMARCSSQALANAAWAMVRLRHAPSASWLQDLAAEARRRLKGAAAATAAGGGGGGREFTPQGASVLLLSVAQLSAASPAVAASPALGELWCELAAQLLPGAAAPEAAGAAAAAVLPRAAAPGRLALECFTPQGLAAVAGAAAMAGAEQGEQLVLAAMAQAALRQQRRLALADASMLLWAAATLGLQPPAGLNYALARVALQRVEELAPPRCASPGAPSAASSGGGSSSSGGGEVAEPRGGERWEPQRAPQPIAAPAVRQVGAAIWALAAMGFHPGGAWLRRWFGATQPLLGGCSSQTLALLLWGSVHLEAVPPRRWLVAWAHAWQRHHRPLHGLQDAAPVQVAAAAAAQGARLLQRRPPGSPDAVPRGDGAALLGLCQWLVRDARRRRVWAAAQGEAIGAAVAGD